MAAALVALSCGTPTVPATSEAVADHPAIYPDYVDVTIPCNIAPLTFEIKEKGDEYVTRLTAGADEIILGGSNVCPPLDEWQAMLATAKEGSVKVEVFVSDNGRWKAYKPFAYNVSSDTIDPYISYRLIPPSYVCYEALTISQRNLTNYDEKVIYNNMLGQTESEGSCINCHAYKNYRTDNMQFHVRQLNGGTFFVHNGEPRKLNMATDSTLSAGVYPAFNPVYDVVAYSVNKTGQIFHTRNSNKVEVQDVASDVIIYNPVSNTVTNVSNNPNDLEVFPWWSPDGRTLYYGSAHFEVIDTANSVMKEEIIRYRDIKYDILRRSWNPDHTSLAPSIQSLQPRAWARAPHSPASRPTAAICSLRWASMAVSTYGTRMPTFICSTLPREAIGRSPRPIRSGPRATTRGAVTRAGYSFRAAARTPTTRVCSLPTSMPTGKPRRHLCCRSPRPTFTQCSTARTTSPNLWSSL